MNKLSEVNAAKQRLHEGKYVAEIIRSRYGDLEIFHYVIQPKGSREVLHYGQARSLEEAKDAVQIFFADLALQQDRKRQPA